MDNSSAFNAGCFYLREAWWMSCQNRLCLYSPNSFIIVRWGLLLVIVLLVGLVREFIACCWCGLYGCVEMNYFSSVNELNWFLVTGGLEPYIKKFPMTWTAGSIYVINYWNRELSSLDYCSEVSLNPSTPSTDRFRACGACWMTLVAFLFGSDSEPTAVWHWGTSRPRVPSLVSLVIPELLHTHSLSCSLLH